MFININEVYFGKTPEIMAIENQLDKFRRNYMGKYLIMGVNNDPDLIRLNRMFENQFGFGCFSLNIVTQLIENAFTMPIDMRYDVFNTNKKLIANKNTFKFNKDADYTCVVCIYSGLIFNPAYTTEEIMACILHEIGHNFYAALDKKHGILAKLYQVLVLADSIINISKCMEDLEKLEDLSPEKKEIINHINQIVYGTIQNTEIYQKIVNKLEKTLRKNQSVLITIHDAFEYFSSLLQMVPITIYSFIDIITLGGAKLIGSMGYVSSKALNPLSYITGFIMYGNEKLADNFPTMYGYGSALASLSTKLGDLSYNPSKIMSEFSKIPVLYNIYCLNADLSNIIVSIFDEHPTALVRVNDQIRLLEREASKSDLDPKMKKVILADIKESKSILLKLIDTNSSMENKHILRNMWYKVLRDNFDTRTLKDTIIDDKNKFDIYDKTYSDRHKY